MEEEINLRPYIELLIKRWYVIVGAAILAGLIAFGVTALQDPVYEATALVAVTQERLIAQFDPRLETTEERQPVDALPELATSDEFLSSLLDEIDPPLQNISSVADLEKLLTAQQGADPSLIRLTAQHEQADISARIANLWASQFVMLSNDIYGDGGQEQVTFFEEQLVQASEDLASAEEALIAFQSINRIAVISNLLDSLKKRQSRDLEQQHTLNDLIVDVEDLHFQLSEEERSSPVSFADQLTALALQLRAFNAVSELPIQIQLDGSNSLNEATRSEQVDYLETLIGILDSRADDIKQDVIELEPEILQLQGELQEAEAELNRLTLNRDIAQETYQSLARKVDEERITAQDMTRGIRLASEASVPENEARTAPIVSIVTVSFIAVILLVLIIMLRAWWSGADQNGATNSSADDSKS